MQNNYQQNRSPKLASSCEMESSTRQTTQPSLRLFFLRRKKTSQKQCKTLRKHRKHSLEDAGPISDQEIRCEYDWLQEEIVGPILCPRLPLKTGSLSRAPIFELQLGRTDTRYQTKMIGINDLLIVVIAILICGYPSEAVSVLVVFFFFFYDNPFYLFKPYSHRRVI